MTKGLAWHSGDVWQVKHCSQHHTYTNCTASTMIQGGILTNSTSLPSRKGNQRTLLRALHYITCRTFYKFSEMHTSEHRWPHSFLLSILNFLFLSQYLEMQSLVVGKTAGDRTLHLSRQLEGFACRQNSWTIHPSTTPAPVRDTSELQSQLETQAPSGNQKSRRGKATGKCVI